MEEKTAISTTTMVVWLVRICLPIIFFFIWYRLGPGKSGGDENEYSREDLLLAREATKGCEVPESLSNIKMVEEARVGTPSSASRQVRTNSGARPKRGSRTPTVFNDQKSDRANSLDFGFGLDDGAVVELSSATGEGSAAALLEASAADKAAKAAADKAAKPLLSKIERVHFESLLNFVAFGPNSRPQRVFLPSEGRPPPPPPQKKAPSAIAPLEEEDSSESFMANEEAQVVLKAAANNKIGVKCAQIAKDLHEKLSESQVRISETTFTLMVETCINGSDLKAASGFLMKMESSGLCPDSDLLDKVMDLYSESRATAQSDKSPGSEATPSPGRGSP